MMMTTGGVRLSTVVMTHPSRKHLARSLQERYPQLGIRIVLDPDPTGPAATMRTARLAWRNIEEGATHHLVLQDDVVPCSSFPEAVVSAIAAVPDDPVALHIHWSSRTAQAVRLATLVGASWTPVIDPYVPTQALVMPADLAAEYAQWAMGLPWSAADNDAVYRFLAERGLTTYLSIPNLIEHGSDESILSHDFLKGVRNSVLFAADLDLGRQPLDTSVAVPALIGHCGSDAGYVAVYSRPEEGMEWTSVRAHDLLAEHGVSNRDVAERFTVDLAAHEAALAESGLGHPFAFHLWLTTFVQGIVSHRVLDSVDPSMLEIGLRRPWARPALSTFPAGVLRRFIPAARLNRLAQLLTPLCVDGLRAGFAAPERWPDLKAICATAGPAVGTRIRS